MSDDEKRTALLHAIAAWREAADDHPPGSPEYQYFQNKRTTAEWELQRLDHLDLPQAEPGSTVKVVSPESHKEK
jgi:hypothetical protein